MGKAAGKTILLNKVNKLFRAGKTRVAKDLLREALALSPKDSQLQEAIDRMQLLSSDNELWGNLDEWYLNEVDSQFHTVKHYKYGEEKPRHIDDVADIVLDKDDTESSIQVEDDYDLVCENVCVDIDQIGVTRFNQPDPIGEEQYQFDPDNITDNESDTTFDFPSNLSRQDRANQIAIEFADQYDWSTSSIDLLSCIFNNGAWGSTRKVLSEYVELGTNVDELTIAYQLRSAWKQSTHYWIILYPSGQSKYSYKNLSWAQSLRLIQVYSTINQTMPEFEDMICLLEELFTEWFSSDTLRIDCPAFSKFLTVWIYQCKNFGLPLYARHGFGSLCESNDYGWTDNGEYDLLENEQMDKMLSYGFSYGGAGFLINPYLWD